MSTDSAIPNDSVGARWMFAVMRALERSLKMPPFLPQLAVDPPADLSAELAELADYGVTEARWATKLRGYWVTCVHREFKGQSTPHGGDVGVRVIVSLQAWNAYQAEVTNRIVDRFWVTHNRQEAAKLLDLDAKLDESNEIQFAVEKILEATTPAISA